MPSLEDVEYSAVVTYRSIGLGAYGAVMRTVGMPLEKIAIIMNSSQVSAAKSDGARLGMAVKLAFADGPLAPYRVIGRASLVAWMLQYSVMGFVFMLCDTALSKAMRVPRVVYGDELMEPPGVRKGLMRTINNNDNDSSGGDSGNNRGSVSGPQQQQPPPPQPQLRDTSTPTGMAMSAAKIVAAPLISGCIESFVANRAEVQRYYGIGRFAAIEKQLGWGALRRACGPAFAANASRNFIMASTSFIITPITFKHFYPQERKSQQSLVWFGLGMNVFVGNTVAITQQALWGRALDYGAHGGGRAVVYADVVRQGFKAEGVAAFYTPARWLTRVLMNAPAQGTLPWFYNHVLPVFEEYPKRVAAAIAPLVGATRE